MIRNSKLKIRTPLFLSPNKQSPWRRRRWFDNGISAAAATPQPPAPPARGSSDHLRRFLRSSHSIRAPLLSRSVSVRYRSSPSPSPLHLSMLSLSFSLFTFLPLFFNGFAAYFYFVFIYLVCRPTTSMVQLEYPFFMFRLGIHIYIYIYSKSSLKLSDLILIKYDCLRLRNKQRDGGKLDRDIWSSRNAQFYHGCSIASSKFASVYLFQCCLFVAYDLI